MKSNYLDKTIAAYNKSAHEYLQTTKDMILVPEVTEFVKHLPKDGLVLDAGCSYGKYSKLFMERGYKVVGIDLSEALIQKANMYVPAGEFRIMDVRKLQFQDAFFSGVWSAATLLHLTIEDIKIALIEFNRVLKKNGILFVSFKEGAGSRIVKGNFEGAQERFFTFITKNQLAEFVTDAGFSLLKTGGDNERERYGKNYRDQNWIHAFAIKK